MAFTKIVAAGINTGSSYTFQDLNTVGIVTAGTVQVGAATTVHTTGIDLGSGNITSHNINSTGIITATSFVGPVTGNITGDITATSGTFSGNVSIAGTLTYEDVTNIDSVGIITARSDVNIENTAPTLNLIDTDGSTTASLLGNSGNIFYDTSSINRDHIFRGSTTEVVRITGDGSVGIGTVSPANKLSISDPGYTGIELQSDRTTATDNIGGLHFRTLSTNVAYIQSLVDGTVRIRNTSSLTERLRINSDGKVMMGNSSASINRNLSITGVTGNSNDAEIGLQPTNSSGGINPEAIIGATADGAYGAHMFFTTRDTSGNRTERLRITSGGNCGIGITNPEKNLVVSSSSSPTIRINNSDGSISADQIIGAIEFKSNDGSGDGSQVTGSIESISQAAFTGQGSPSHLIFKTNGVSGANALQERFRIKSNGDLKHTGLRIGGGDNKLAILVTPSHNTNEEDVIVYQVENEGSFNQITFGGGTSAYNAATQISFKTASAVDTTGGSESLRITSGGNVAIGADAYGNVAPLSKLHVSSTGTTTAIGADHGYLRSSCQILCQSSDNVNNSKSGIMFSGALHSTDGCSAAVVATHENVAENSETTSLSFYTSHNETLKESLKITSHSQFEMNGVRNIYQSFVLVNNQNYNWDFTVPNEGGYGNSFYLVAGYNHYYTTSYGAHRTVWFSARGTSVNGMGNGIEQTSGNAGSWTFSKPNATTVRITKTSGTYGGSGYGFFHLTYNHF